MSELINMVDSVLEEHFREAKNFEKEVNKSLEGVSVSRVSNAFNKYMYKPYCFMHSLEDKNAPVPLVLINKHVLEGLIFATHGAANHFTHDPIAYAAEMMEGWYGEGVEKEFAPFAVYCHSEVDEDERHIEFLKTKNIGVYYGDG